MWVKISGGSSVKDECCEGEDVMVGETIGVRELHFR